MEMVLETETQCVQHTTEEEEYLQDEVQFELQRHLFNI